MNSFERQKIQEREDHQEKQSEETMDEIRLWAKENCDYLKKRPAGDEVYYWCDLSDHPCTVEYDDGECEEHADFVAELLKEKEKEQCRKLQ